MVSLNSMAQDLIARQAPSDRKMTDIRNVKLNNTAISADLNNPASNIYTSWSNAAISKVEGYCAANYKIDLRGFHMPTPSRKVTSNFGPRWGRQHAGLDIKVYIGDTIRSAFDGKVRIVKYDGNGYGYYVVIRHPNGLETLYGHMSKQIVKENQIVRAGEPIGLGGNTGRSTGSHLHFETRVLGQPINPALMFDFVNQDVTGDYFVVKSAMSKGNTTTARATHSTEAEASNYVAQASEPANEVASAPAVAAPSTSKSKSKAAPKSVSYKVKSGDTLSSIARQHGTTVDKLMKLNGLKGNSVIRQGQVIKCS